MIEIIDHDHLLPGELQLGLDGKDGNICSECDLHHYNYFMKILYFYTKTERPSLQHQESSFMNLFIGKKYSNLHPHVEEK